MIHTKIYTKNICMEYFISKHRLSYNPIQDLMKLYLSSKLLRNYSNALTIYYKAQFGIHYERHNLNETK